jgi:hypothetical protein
MGKHPAVDQPIRSLLFSVDRTIMHELRDVCNRFLAARSKWKMRLVVRRQYVAVALAHQQPAPSPFLDGLSVKLANGKSS